MVRACQQSHCPCQNILYWKYFINSIFCAILLLVLPAVDCSSPHPAFGIQCHVFCHSNARVAVVDHCSSGFRYFCSHCDKLHSELITGREPAIWSRLGICLLCPGLILVFNMTSIKYLQACQAPSVYYLLAMSFSNSDGLKTNNTR